MLQNLFYTRVIIQEFEMGLLFANEQFQRVLPVGEHKLRRTSTEYRIERHKVLRADQGAAVAQVIRLASRYPDKFEPYLTTYRINEDEVGLVYDDGNLVDIKGPSESFALWKMENNIDVIKQPLTSSPIEERMLRNFLGARLARLSNAVERALFSVKVPPGSVGVLEEANEGTTFLSPGLYGYYRFNRDYSVRLYDLRQQAIEINGQEILTKDRVSLRINLSATWKIEGIERLVAEIEKPNEYLYRELQLALRTVVSSMTLDELLADKNALNAEIRMIAAPAAEAVGIGLITVGAKDIVLPGDMKTILSQVVEAQKQAEANLIRRREETQATRSLHNTAKVMEGNPTLLRLKELETLEKITGNISTLNVYGGLEGVMNSTIKLA
ncbi:MAG: slipin family protein [Gammaproteobacteria bacterium]|nr:slipin family protein [Gammaproteobacteria bacterium]